MKKLVFILLFLTLNFSIYAQTDLKITAQRILEKGMELYKMEKAVWYAWDSLNNITFQKYTSGFVSYYRKNFVNTVFYEIRDEQYFIQYTFQFENNTNLKLLKCDDSERIATDSEVEYIEIKEGTYDMLEYFDNMFKTHENTGKNISILKKNGVYEIFVITGENNSGSIPIGGDYKFKCKENESTIEFLGAFHKKYDPITISTSTKRMDEEFHYHSSETSEFITPTDICSLMLYKNFTETSVHLVISDNYVSVFDFKNTELKIFPKDIYNEKFGTNY